MRVLLMRRLSLFLVVVLAATFAPAAFPAAHAKRMTITILSLTQVTMPHDTTPKGRENKGDFIQYKALLVTVGPLFGRHEKNQPVGYEAGTQTFTSSTDVRVNGQATFPGQGTIEFRGDMRTLKNGLVSVPVVGGTGKFTGADGVLLIGPGDLKSVNTYRLSLPGAGVA
jgi:hypothetical protein